MEIMQLTWIGDDVSEDGGGGNISSSTSSESFSSILLEMLSIGWEGYSSFDERT